MDAESVNHPSAFADALCAAVNAHDVDRVVSCFAEDYVNETPTHPARGFRGREQVRRNWTQIFEAVPDIEAELVSTASAEDRIWTEWEMRGTRRDGVPHLMRGVMILTVVDGRARRVRFYVEPVTDDAADADAAVRAVLTQP